MVACKTRISTLEAPATRLIEDQLEQVSAGGSAEFVILRFSHKLNDEAQETDETVSQWTLSNALPMK